MFDRLFRIRASGLQQEHQDQQDVIYASLDSLIQLRLAARQLSISSRLPSSNLQAGSHLSHFKGRGMDYLESRQYQAGDDIRNMDWRVTARTGNPHVKLFQEERQRPVLIMVDFNPGMFFASRGRFKSVVAAEAAALLAWSAARHGDHVGGLVTNAGHEEIPPAGNKRGVLSLLHQLADHGNPSHQAGPDTDPAQAFTSGLKRLVRLTRPGSLVFILSDFYALDDSARQPLAILRSRADCTLLRVLDPIENSPPPANRYAVTDGQQQTLLDTTDSDQAERYREWFRQHQQVFTQITQQLGLARIELQTSEAPLAALKRAFHAGQPGRRTRMRQQRQHQSQDQLRKNPAGTGQ